MDGSDATANSFDRGAQRARKFVGKGEGNLVAFSSRIPTLHVPPSVGEVSDSDQIDWLVVVVIK